MLPRQGILRGVSVLPIKKNGMLISGDTVLKGGAICGIFGSDNISDMILFAEYTQVSDSEIADARPWAIIVADKR